MTIEMRGRALRPFFAAQIDRFKREIAVLGAPEPTLATLMVGSPDAAISYRASIQRVFDGLGVGHRDVVLPSESSAHDIVGRIRELNFDPSVTGIMAFLPSRDAETDHRVREEISPLKDVDGISPTSAGRLRLNIPTLLPSCPAGGIVLLRHYGVPIAGARAAVVGRSPVVGAPLAAMLSSLDATVTTCHRATKDLADLTRAADIVATAAGRVDVVTAGMIRPGAAVLDFGTNIVDGRLRGDTDPATMPQVAGWRSPVPGGTGPVTAMMIALQTTIAAIAQVQGDLAHLPPVLHSISELVGAVDAHVEAERREDALPLAELPAGT